MIQLQALSYAVTCNKADIVAVLLEHNADATVIDRYNLTPKDIADEKGFTEVINILNSILNIAKLFLSLFRYPLC